MMAVRSEFKPTCENDSKSGKIWRPKNGKLQYSTLFHSPVEQWKQATLEDFLSLCFYHFFKNEYDHVSEWIRDMSIEERTSVYTQISQ